MLNFKIMIASVMVGSAFFASQSFGQGASAGVGTTTSGGTASTPATSRSPQPAAPSGSYSQQIDPSATSGTGTASTNNQPATQTGQSTFLNGLGTWNTPTRTQNIDGTTSAADPGTNFEQQTQPQGRQ